MNRLQPIALVIAGNTRLPMLRRLPHIEERLGPVRSTSFRLAGGMVKTLGAGHAVQDVREFDSCGIILLSMPDQWLTSSLEELLDANIRWRAKTVLLCGSRHDSSVLEKLAFLGASTGSVTPVPG